MQYSNRPYLQKKSGRRMTLIFRKATTKNVLKIHPQTSEELQLNQCVSKIKQTQQLHQLQHFFGIKSKHQNTYA
jgi:hypothetical protein